LIALMQTRHRFRSKRQLWTYSGLDIETHDSAQFRFVRGSGSDRCRGGINIHLPTGNGTCCIRFYFRGPA
jgi:transposase